MVLSRQGIQVLLDLDVSPGEPLRHATGGNKTGEGRLAFLGLPLEATSVTLVAAQIIEGWHIFGEGTLLVRVNDWSRTRW
jgi:hypothetical protein